MGKYDKIHLDVITEDNIRFDLSSLLKVIANELAEANRLRRLELRLKIAQPAFVVNELFDEKELKDRA